MSRYLIRGAVTASILALWIAAEMNEPGVTWLTIRVIGLMGEHLLTAGLWSLLVIGALVGIGYVAAIIRHHAAIRDAHVERIHERKITAFRAQETARIVHLAPFRLRDQHANKPGANR